MAQFQISTPDEPTMFASAQAIGLIPASQAYAPGLVSTLTGGVNAAGAWAANLYGAKIIPVLHQTGTTPATTDPTTGAAVPAQPIMTPVTTTDPATGAVTQVMQTVPGYFGILELPDGFALPTIPPGVAIEPIPSDPPVVFS